MNHAELDFDIRTPEAAKSTLCRLSHVSPKTWENSLQKIDDYDYQTDFIFEIIKKYGSLPDSYRDFDYFFTHVTTSANECVCIKKHGLIDLCRSYLLNASELRTFLDKYGVQIDLPNRLLEYHGTKFDISYNPAYRPSFFSQEQYAYNIGRKFYYDYAVCGFLSIDEDVPYLGDVHCRPEILADVDSLLHTDFSRKWYLSHKPYAVQAHISGKDIIFDGDDNWSEEDKVIHYLTEAFSAAYGYPTERTIILKNNISVPPCNIIDIQPLTYSGWIR